MDGQRFDEDSEAEGGKVEVEVRNKGVVKDCGVLGMFAFASTRSKVCMQR